MQSNILTVATVALLLLVTALILSPFYAAYYMIFRDIKGVDDDEEDLNVIN